MLLDHAVTIRKLYQTIASKTLRHIKLIPIYCRKIISLGLLLKVVQLKPEYYLPTFTLGRFSNRCFALCFLLAIGVLLP